MSHYSLQVHVSYSQFCIFQSELDQPFNDWSDRSYSQGFAWRSGSVSFRTTNSDTTHTVFVFLNEPVPLLVSECTRAFRVPLNLPNGTLDVGSISDSTSLVIEKGMYILQVELFEEMLKTPPYIVVRLNRGDIGFSIIKADDTITVDAELDLQALPAT